MGLFSKKEFAQMCGMKVGHLTTYITRGKIIQRSDEMVDDSERINMEFLEHRRANFKVKPISSKTVHQISSESKNSSQTKTTQEIESSDSNDSNAEYATLQNRKAKADLEKKLIDTKSAILNYEILKGKHIPTDMARDVIMELGRSILTNYKDSAESILTEFSHRKSLTPPEHAEMKGILIDHINLAHTKAIEATKKQIIAAIDDFKKANKMKSDADEQTEQNEN